MIEKDWYKLTAAKALQIVSAGDAAAIESTDRLVTASLIRNVLRAAQRHKQPDKENMLDFLLHMGRWASLSQSQICQDLLALWETDQKRNGFFVEFGAVDGKRLSNTYMLERYFDWRGIVSEPNPEFSSALAANRECFKSFECVYSKTGEFVPFRIVSSPEFSRIASIAPQDKQEKAGLRESYKEVMVPTISLNDLLIKGSAPRVIDFMSVDTEGSEFEILEALDFDRWSFRLITVEHNRTPNQNLIYDLLTRAGYRRKWSEMAGIEDWYVPSKAS